MKNIYAILLLAGFIFCTQQTNAQLRAGFKGGVNFSGFSNHDGGKRFSGHGGIFIHNVMNKNFHLQAELLYSSEGQGYTVVQTEQNEKRVVAVNSVSLPVMLQYYIHPCYYIETGPQLSFITGVKDKGPGSEKLNVKRSYANTQFGFNIGMGVLAGKHFELYIRYCIGLTDLTLYEENADYSRVLQAGVLFRLK